ncbi:MAG TPA: low molecular weight protein-tyrosine-phosphatase [Nocardioidaceae bacterium]|nr:low molecular weight protein-tyrosine-phosphatase [Nocardioidaceae bacterium]
MGVTVPYRIAVVCLGNICRSPMAGVVLADRVARAGLGDRVDVVTAGTGDWHIGSPMDRRAAAVLAAAGLDPSEHRARQFDPDWFEDFDLVLAMDAANRADLATLAAAAGGNQERVRMFRDFDPLADDGDREVPDPYYGGDEGFDTVMAMVQRTADQLVAWLEGQPLGSDRR